MLLLLSHVRLSLSLYTTSELGKDNGYARLGRVLSSTTTELREYVHRHLEGVISSQADCERKRLESKLKGIFGVGISSLCYVTFPFPNVCVCMCVCDSQQQSTRFFI